MVYYLQRERRKVGAQMEDDNAVSLGQRLYALCQTPELMIDTNVEQSGAIYPWTGKSEAHRTWEWRARRFREDVLERERVANPEVPLSSLGLRGTTWHPLYWAMIETIGDVLHYSDEELLRFHGFGKKGLAELRFALRSRGLSS